MVSIVSIVIGAPEVWLSRAAKEVNNKHTLMTIGWRAAAAREAKKAVATAAAAEIFIVFVERVIKYMLCEMQKKPQ